MHPAARRGSVCSAPGFTFSHYVSGLPKSGWVLLFARLFLNINLLRVYESVRAVTCGGPKIVRWYMGVTNINHTHAGNCRARTRD